MIIYDLTPSEMWDMWGRVESIWSLCQDIIASRISSTSAARHYGTGPPVVGSIGEIHRFNGMVV